MSKGNKSLSEKIAEEILALITIEKKFAPGDKLPNENQLASELQVSRTTLRESIRILAAHNVLEIKRGRGTYIKKDFNISEDPGLLELALVKPDLKDLYEMRLIFEPQLTYYAAKRAHENELERIIHFGKMIEECILKKEDRTEAELEFHKAIAKAAHNEFMNKLMPILYKAIYKGVPLSDHNQLMVQSTLIDHQMIMEFLKQRDAQGAKTAMKLHILRAMRGFGISDD